MNFLCEEVLRRCSCGVRLFLYLNSLNWLHRQSLNFLQKNSKSEEKDDSVLFI